MKKTENARKSSFFIALALAVAALAVALIFFNNANRNRISQQNTEYLTDNTRQVADSIDAALSDGYDNIKILSELVSRSLTGPDFDISSIQSLVTNSVFDFIEFADVQGMDHNITGGVSDATDRMYYLDAKNGNTGMELIYVSRATHETLLMFYSPVYYEGQFAGSLVGVYQASNRITKLLSTEYYGQPSTSYLATAEGRIIASNQGLDPQIEFYVSDLAQGDAELEDRFAASIESGETMTFSVPGSTAGGCMVKLEESGWYLILIFPQQVTDGMIRSANRLGYVLVAFLILLFLIIMLALVRFYRRQQKLVEEARKQAENANRSKSNFLFSMSHDIRTPINAVTGFTAMAKKYIDDKAKVGSYLEKIEISGQQLLQLVNQVLEMARIESGKAELNERPVSIKDSHEAIATVLSAQAEIKGIKFTHSLNNIVHWRVLADDARMGQITFNVTGNALKYTPEGGKVDMSLTEIPCDRDGYAAYVLSVSDTGIGMSEEYQKKIFEPFSRENSSTESKIQGSGLGMSIVKSLVDLVGGEIEVESEKGKGTTFNIRLCFKTVEENETPDSAHGISRDVSFSGRRVLLVEDNEMNREIAKDILEEYGITVEEATDGDEAVAAVEAAAERGDFGYYDFILMDVQMPRMNGYEATRQIRKIPVPNGVHIPIIAMTANAFEEDRRDALEAGMDDHLAKPVDIDKLWTTLASYI